MSAKSAKKMSSLPKKHLDRIKRRLGVTGKAETKALMDFVEDAVQDILNFCNREDLPPELCHEAARLAAEAYGFGKIENRDPEAQDEMVNSVSLAGVKIGYGISADQRDLMSKKLGEQIQRSSILKQFRLLRRVAMPKPPQQ